MKLKQISNGIYAVWYEYSTQYGVSRKASFCYNTKTNKLELYEGEFDDIAEYTSVKYDVENFIEGLGL